MNGQSGLTKLGKLFSLERRDQRFLTALRCILAAALACLLSLARTPSGGAYFFRIAIENRSDLSEQGEIRRSVSVTVLSACALMALVPWKLFDLVSVGRTLALIVLMASALKGGMLTGAAAGSVLGITTDLASGGSCFYAMSFALSGLLGGVFSRHSRLVFTLSFVLASALAATCAWSDEDMTVVTVRVEERV